METTGTISRKLKVDLDAVSYAIRKLAIKPIARAGIVRIFPDNTLSKVKTFLKNKRKKLTSK